MGENSAISWTTHTFNPWWGCVKVSPACTNCYAAAFDHRLGGKHWGQKSDRKFFGDKHWNEPRRWNRAAQKSGVRARVFCASMADVFEDRPDLVQPRARLWRLISETPWLDWLLLTKRPENLSAMLPWVADGPGLLPWGNVWLGTTAENQEYADERIPHLCRVPAVVHFLSCEPLLGPIALPVVHVFGKSAPPSRINWLITGCESGRGARDTRPEWIRSLRDQCAEAGCAFFLKQATPWDEGRTTIVAMGIGVGDGSHAKSGGVVELPYLDGRQHAAFPEVSR